MAHGLYYFVQFSKWEVCFLPRMEASSFSHFGFIQPPKQAYFPIACGSINTKAWLRTASAGTLCTQVHTNPVWVPVWHKVEPQITLSWKAIASDDSIHPGV